MTSPRSLADWLALLESRHPLAIELGLDRVAAVAGRLGLDRPAPRVVTVAGTNGKGSCVALLEALLLRAGVRVGAYTSPHLLAYNERVRIAGQPASDAALCAAFARIEAARGDIRLTYFEVGTLAALLLFVEAGCEVAVLEVGLGGRLDAVNIVAPDVAVITSIDLDHQAWLGDDRDRIGVEGGHRPAGCPPFAAIRRHPRPCSPRSPASARRCWRSAAGSSDCTAPRPAWRWTAPPATAPRGTTPRCRHRGCPRQAQPVRSRHWSHWGCRRQRTRSPRPSRRPGCRGGFSRSTGADAA